MPAGPSPSPPSSALASWWLLGNCTKPRPMLRNTDPRPCQTSTRWNYRPPPPSARLTELGETDSVWIIAVEGEARERINALLPRCR